MRTSKKKGGKVPETNRLNSQLAVAYVRVSSREQSEGFSISAQKKLLADYASRNGLHVVHIFEEAETAKKAGRKQFDLMLEWVEQHPEVGNILVEKTDRLYRNLTDYTRLDVELLRIRVHLVKDGDILEPGSRSQSKFMHGIRVLMAKNYIDNLSEEVRKGQMEKARQGIWPSSAPIGYKNNAEGRNIVPHPQHGPLIRKGFELAATGQYSLSRLKRELHNMGLRSRRAGNELGKEAMARVLRNPIYYGDFVWSGQTFKGIHEPLISKQLFERTQEAMGFVQKPRLTKHNFTYVGLLKCGHCGCAITAERQKKKSGRTYVYYHCTNGKGSCTNVTFIREESLEISFASALRAIKISPDILEWTRKALLESAEEERTHSKTQIAALTAQYKKVESYISQCYQDRLEGRIDADFWQTKTEAWRMEQRGIEERLNALRGAKAAYLEEGVRLLEIANRAAELFHDLEGDEKREMLAMLLSNPRILNGNLDFSYKNPFAMFTNVVNLNEMRAKRDVA